MDTRATLGHKSRRDVPMHAIIFDLDNDTLTQIYPGAAWDNADPDVRTYLTACGFEGVQGSGYLGNNRVGAVRCVLKRTTIS